MSSTAAVQERSESGLELAQLDTYPREYPFSRQIEDILEQFNDFDAALLFEAAEIKWPTQGGLAFPSRAQIRGTAKRLLVEQALALDGWRSGCGFFVLKANDRLGLYFTPVHGESFGEGYPEEVEGDNLKATGERVGYFNNIAPDTPLYLIARLGDALALLTAPTAVSQTGLAVWKTYWNLREALGLDSPRQPDKPLAVRTLAAPLFAFLAEARDPHSQTAINGRAALRAVGYEAAEPPAPKPGALAGPDVYRADLWQEVRELREELNFAKLTADDVVEQLSPGSNTQQQMRALSVRIAERLEGSRSRVGVGEMYPDPQEGAQS